MSAFHGCGTCVFFEDRPDDLERRLPHMASLSSAYASSRADDGLCTKHERFVAETSCCGAYLPAREFTV